MMPMRGVRNGSQNRQVLQRREKLVARQKRLLAAQDELFDAFENAHVP